MDEDFYESTKIGLSYSTYLNSLTQKQLKSFDYIEVPFELMNFDSAVLPKISMKPIILHCASLSLGGYTPPAEKTRERIKYFVEKTNTPWIGEHLSYILAEKLDDQFYEPYSNEPYNIGYTVNPVMNSRSVDNIINNIARNQDYFKTPLIVENSPQYFKLPGSDMSQSAFITSICKNSETKLLLDLTHLYISAQNFSFDPKMELSRLPLDRVVEVHISGLSGTGQIHWDNHATHAPEIIFELLEIVLKNANPRAITFEYNWTPDISWDKLYGEFSRVREMLIRH